MIVPELLPPVELSFSEQATGRFLHQGPVVDVLATAEPQPTSVLPPAGAPDAGPLHATHAEPVPAPNTPSHQAAFETALHSDDRNTTVSLLGEARAESPDKYRDYMTQLGDKQLRIEAANRIQALDQAAVRGDMASARAIVAAEATTDPDLYSALVKRFRWHQHNPSEIVKGRQAVERTMKERDNKKLSATMDELYVKARATNNYSEYNAAQQRLYANDPQNYYGALNRDAAFKHALKNQDYSTVRQMLEWLKVRAEGTGYAHEFNRFRSYMRPEDIAGALNVEQYRPPRLPQRVRALAHLVMQKTVGRLISPRPSMA